MVSAADVIGGLTYPVTFWLYASQVPLCWQMSREGYGSSGRYSFMPTLCTMLNCLLWASYGLLNGKGGSVLGVNSGGVLFCLLYAVCFLVYAPGLKGRVHLLTQLASVAAILILVDLPLFLLRPLKAVTILGCICVAVNIVLFASPVLSIAHAMRARDVSRVPVMMTFASLVCGCLWTTLGVLSGDLFVAIPNVVGIFLTVAQLGVTAYVRSQPPASGKGDKDKPGTSTSSGSAAAMGKGDGNMLHEALFSGGRGSPPMDENGGNSRRTSASSISLAGAATDPNPNRPSSSTDDLLALAAEEGRMGSSGHAAGEDVASATATGIGSSAHLRQRSVAPLEIPSDSAMIHIDGLSGAAQPQALSAVARSGHARARSVVSQAAQEGVLGSNPGIPRRAGLPSLSIASLKRQYTGGDGLEYTGTGGTGTLEGSGTVVSHSTAEGGLGLVLGSTGSKESGLDTGGYYAGFKTAQPGSFVGYPAAAAARVTGEGQAHLGSGHAKEGQASSGEMADREEVAGYAPTKLDWDALGASSAGIYTRA